MSTTKYCIKKYIKKDLSSLSIKRYVEPILLFYVCIIARVISSVHVTFWGGLKQRLLKQYFKHSTFVNVELNHLSRSNPEGFSLSLRQSTRVYILCRGQRVGELDGACQIALLAPVFLRKRHALFSYNLNKMD